ncbi:MAG TPA: UvrD-helicase domain-containing protein, partial [Patescibacteria group bacterium]|nr:UvrD-helicase domain-containing protein [Patescibacteria group bacterium]
MSGNGDKKLNDQQIKAIKYKSGPLLIIAGAGTGKTTVISERIKYLITKNFAKPSEILALTFTEKAAKEMEERVDVAMPYGYTQMWISTFHSFCDRVLRREALHIGLDPKYKLNTQSESIQFIRQNLFKFDLNYFRPLGNPTKFISGMLQHFSRLQDEDITPNEYLKFTEKQKKSSKSSGMNPKTKEQKIEIMKWKELADAYKTYDELKVKEGVMDFGDLIIKTLKLFRERPNILKDYRKQFKYFLVDEFQDTNVAQYELLKLLASLKNNNNLTVVGDDSQCLPPNARITTVNGLEQIKNVRVGDKVFTAVGKGHTSTSKVTKIFHRIRKARFITFQTENRKKIIVTDNHKMFCFLPALYKPKDWHFVYLMHQENLGWRIGVTNNLTGRLRLEHHADRIFALGSYKTDQEARFFESYLSAKYGLPTIPFSPRPHQAISGKWLTRLFKDINTTRNAQILANDFGLELESPVFAVDGVTRGMSKRVKVNLIMCHRSYRSKVHKNGFVGNPGVLHSVNLETSNKDVIKLLEREDYILHNAKRGKRFRMVTSSLLEAWKVAEKLSRITGGIIDKKFVVGKFNYQHLPARIVPASHIFPGMYLPVLVGKHIEYKIVVSRSEKLETVETYDLEIEKTHNFIADGVVVHNSIYKFRGAAISNIMYFKKDYKKVKTV